MELFWEYLVFCLFYLGTRQFNGILAAKLDHKNYPNNIGKRSLGGEILADKTQEVRMRQAEGNTGTWQIAGNNIVLEKERVNTGFNNEAGDAPAHSSSIDGRPVESNLIAGWGGGLPQSRRGDGVNHINSYKHGGRSNTAGRRSKRDTTRSHDPPSKQWWHHLNMLVENDTSLAVLQYVEELSKIPMGPQDDTKCRLDKDASLNIVTGGSHSHNNIGSLLNSSISHEYYSGIFAPHVNAAVRISNLLSNIFKTWELPNGTLYNEYFFFSLARSLVESNASVVGSTIAFDWKRFRSAGVDHFCPYVYREANHRPRKSGSSNSDNSLGFINLGVKTPGFELCPNQSWFKDMRMGDNTFLWDFNHSKNICKKYRENRAFNEDVPTAVVTPQHGRWFGPDFSCQQGGFSSREWIVSYSIPFYGCTANDSYYFKGVVNTKLDLTRVDIDQCSSDKSRPFANTHRCRRDSTKCEHVAGFGFRRGGYKCVCKAGFYFDTTSTTTTEKYFNGSEIETEYLRYVLNQSRTYAQEFQCLPCDKSCSVCVDPSPCSVEYDILMRGVPLGVTSFCMTIVLVIAYSLLRLRKSKWEPCGMTSPQVLVFIFITVMKASFWLLLEIFIVGALLLYSTIIIQYFEPTQLTCLLIPWFRELGFAIVYGALVLKIYRVLAEFQSRKAHRVHVRDKDLLKWLFCIVCVVVGYMSAWTALNLDHVKDGSSMLDQGKTPEELTYKMCKSSWWDVLIEIGEFLFLCFGIYLCYCIRAAPSDYLETRYISWAIYNETFISAILHIARHILWSITNPDYLFLMYFIRCQLTVTVNVALVLGPKIYYSHHPPDDESYRNRAYSTSDVQDNVLPEAVKLHVGINSNGDVDVGEVNLSDMDPEDIRTELKRLYTQLQIYKTKTMRKDNPHISKRRGGRKHTHRRFSLQAFHNKHRSSHHQHPSHAHPHGHPSASEVSMDHDTEMSRTPEESTNSNEGCGYSMEESTCSVQEVRTPTVTFKPGHKTIY